MEKNKFGKLIDPDSKIHYKMMVIKTVWYQSKPRHVERWNGVRNPEKKGGGPCMCLQKDFSKNVKGTQQR